MCVIACLDPFSGSQVGNWQLRGCANAHGGRMRAGQTLKSNSLKGLQSLCSSLNMSPEELCMLNQVEGGISFNVMALRFALVADTPRKSVCIFMALVTPPAGGSGAVTCYSG